MYCGHCGKQVLGMALKFCTYCGAALHSTEVGVKPDQGQTDVAKIFMAPPTIPPEKEAVKSRGEANTDTTLRVSSASSRALKAAIVTPQNRAVAQPMQPKNGISSTVKAALTLVGIAGVLIFSFYAPVVPYGHMSYLGAAEGDATVSISYALFGCGEVHVQVNTMYGQLSQSEFLCSH